MLPQPFAAPRQMFSHLQPLGATQAKEWHRFGGSALFHSSVSLRFVFVVVETIWLPRAGCANTQLKAFEICSEATDWAEMINNRFQKHVKASALFVKLSWPINKHRPWRASPACETCSAMVKQATIVRS